MRAFGHGYAVTDLHIFGYVLHRRVHGLTTYGHREWIRLAGTLAVGLAILRRYEAATRIGDLMPEWVHGCGYPGSETRPRRD